MGKLLRTASVIAGVAGLGVVLERRFASPHYRGPRTDHFDGVHFLNTHFDPADLTVREYGSFLKWQATRQPGYWPDWIESDPGPKPPERVGGGRMRVTLINHATMLLQVENLNILTDPIWSERCSPVSFIGPRRHRAPGLRFGDLPPIDLVLVSHNHYDHLDVPTLRRIEWTHRPRIITPLGNGHFLTHQGLSNAIEADWWKSVRVSDRAEVFVVPSQHFCARAISDRNKTLWGGFVVSTPSGNAYFAGDTGWGTHFDRIAERFAPIRLAMLPIGAYLPRWFMKPVHVDPPEAVRAHQRLGAATSVAMHYGTFHLGDDGAEQPEEDLKQAIEREGAKGFEVLKHGEGLEV